MSLRKLPALFMRGGTSKAVVLMEKDLPSDATEREAIFLSMMGSPDPYGRQLDGMGGGLSSLSKICILGPSARADADVDYTFAQVPIGQGRVDYSGNCGNMSSAMGPAAIELGICPRPTGSQASIRIFNTNTSKTIVSHFPVAGGVYDAEGDLAIDGVSGTGGPIRLDFLHPGGAGTSGLLPTGRAVDTLVLADGRTVEASCVDAATPCVFVRAQDIGKTGMELPEVLEADRAFLETMEAIRRAASMAMGVTADIASAAARGSIPKVALVAAPRDHRLLSGEELLAERQSIVVRMLSMGQPHRATPITGGICLAAALRLAGTIPSSLMIQREEMIQIAHPSGRLAVDADVRECDDPARAYAVSGSVFRTARKLFSGDIWFRQ